MNFPDGAAHPLLAELGWRGMLHQFTPGLPGRLASGRPLSGYIGFDPSGPSLHIGSLVPVFGLLHLQRHGGRPVALVGSATGMIGDPSGRSSERNLLDRDSLAANAAGIRRQLERFLDFDAGSVSALMVDNLDWLGPMTMLEFLRDVGKHFTVSYMLAKDSVQTRLDRGLSFTEFSYMLLQSADFLHLYRSLGVELQMGGADQWGNITAGLELIRRVEGEVDAAHALSYPLLTLPSGEKFGKTAEGTSVWLDPELTSPFAFYQHWFNAADADVGRYLRFFTLLGREQIAAIEAEQLARPEARPAQRTLAGDVTSRVHGEAATRRVEDVSRAVFSGSLHELDEAAMELAYRELDHAEVARVDADQGALRLGIASGLFPSLGEGRRTIAQGGLSVNGTRITDPAAALPAAAHGRYYVQRVGRRHHLIARVMAGT